MVQLEFGDEIGNGDGMGDVWVAGLPELSLVGFGREFVGFRIAIKSFGGEIFTSAPEDGIYVDVLGYRLLNPQHQR